MADETLARQILEVVPLVMRTVSAEMRQTDPFVVTAHFRLLWLLKHHPHTLSELAERQAVSLPTMSNSVTILEERGWASRKRSEEDRRKLMIEITPAGRRVLEQVHEQMARRVAEIIGSLDDEEREAISHGLLVLRDTFMKAIDECNEAE